MFPTEMASFHRFLRFTFEVEYKFLEIITRLPFPRLLRLFFIFRGGVNFILDRDWRNLLQDHSVREKSANVLSHSKFGLLSITRFISYSLEEADVFCLRSGSLLKNELKDLQKQILDDLEGFPSGGGVWFSCHYGSFTLGILALSSLQRPVFVLGSNVVDSPLLPPSLQAFFHKKYEIMSEYLNGGRILFLEESKRSFFKLLINGSIGVVLADLIAGPHNSSIKLNLFGTTAKVQAGAALFAEKRNMPIGAFLCCRDFLGRPVLKSASLNNYSNDLSCHLQDLFEKILETGNFSPKHWLIADSFWHLSEGD